MARDSDAMETHAAWRPRRGDLAKPSLREAMAAHYVAETDEQASADELERWDRWRKSTIEERARVLAGLLDLVAAMGRFPPKSDSFPGWKEIIAKRNAETTLR